MGAAGRGRRGGERGEMGGRGVAGERTPTSMGVRRMPALGERGSLTCARCLLRGVAGALPESPMAAGARPRCCPAPPAAAIQISRVPGGTAPLAPARRRGPPPSPRPSPAPGTARRFRSPRPARPASPAAGPLSIFGELPAPSPLYWRRSPAPPSVTAEAWLRLDEAAGRCRGPGPQPRCRRARAARDWPEPA